MNKNKKKDKNKQLFDIDKQPENKGNTINSLQMSKSSKDIRIRKMSNSRLSKFRRTISYFYMILCLFYILHN